MQQDIQMKVGFAGASNTGKTTAFSHFVGNMHNNQNTIGVEFKSQIVECYGSKFKLQIWDLGGQEKFRSIVRSYFRGMSICFMFYSLDTPNSLSDVNGLLDCKDMMDDNSLVVLVACTQNFSRSISGPEEGKKFAQTHDLHFMTVDLSIPSTVDEMIFGSIKEYYKRKGFNPSGPCKKNGVKHHLSNIRYVKDKRYYGLFGNNSDIGIPLKNLDIKVQIINSLARVEYSQTYSHSADVLLETEFFFPVNSEACFDSFKASYNDVQIVGVIKEKAAAKKEYEDLKAEGHTVALSEVIETAPDVMKVKLGNIPKDTPITITIAYLEKCKVILNKFWSFKLLSTITPRYDPVRNNSAPVSTDRAMLSSYPTVSKEGAFPWSVQINLQSGAPFTFVKSTTHEIETVYSNEMHVCDVKFASGTNYVPNKDFVLTFINGQEKEPGYFLSKTDEGYWAYVNFFPDFESVNVEKAFAKAKNDPNGILTKTDKTKGDYIFVLDRSGSMSGQRISMAQSALTVFLKSLPKNSTFNIYSFGTTFSSLFNGSKEFSEENVKYAINAVQNYAADMGGTEMYGVLDAIYKSKLDKEYPRSIFLLTDGDISNQNDVFQLIDKNSSKVRVFTIGIGNGCSTHLIKEAAKVGRGDHCFSESGEDMMDKIIGLLQSALSPYCTDFDLKFADSNLVQLISPDPKQMNYLRANQMIDFFILLKPDFAKVKNEKVTLKMFDSSKDCNREFTIELDIEKAESNGMIPKIGVSNIMKVLESQKNNLNADNLDIYFAANSSIREKLLELSLRHQVLCASTAFVCKIKEKDGSLLNIEKKSIIVPTVESIDEPIGSDLSRDYYRSDYVGSSNIKLCASAHKETKSAAGCCGGGGGSYSSSNYSPPPVKEEKKQQSSPPIKTNQLISEPKVDNSKQVSKPSEPIKSETSTNSNNSMISSQSSTQTQSSNSQPVTIQTKQASNSELVKMVELQKLDGFWDEKDLSSMDELVKKAYNGLHKSLQELKIFSDVKVEDLQNLILTLIVLKWLEIRNSSKKNSWILIKGKSVDWIEGLGLDYDKILDETDQEIQEALK